MNFLSILQRHKVLIIILIIIAWGLFLRLFHLTDWLHFQLDQSRDAFLIKDVVEKGVGELPLLGPRAGGSFLRLGPAYYYLMYLLALIAGSSHPIVFVLPEILGSIAFVPMFYLLARRLFTQNWSLILTALAVNSTFLITYDRFSWNPNLMPLFSALTLYTFLRYLEAKRGGEPRSALKWIALTALAAGIIVQLHFVAFVAVPIILILTALTIGIFSKIFLPALAKKYLEGLIAEIAVILTVFLITQTPLLLNEYISGGINTKELFSTVSEKEGKDKSHNIPEKLIQNLWVYPKGYFISMTGIDMIDYPVLLFRQNQFDVICDQKCRQSFAPTVFGSIFFLLAALSFVFVLFKKTRQLIKLKKYPPIRQKKIGPWEIYLLLAIWIAVPWWVFYSLSFSLRPRFFLFSVVPFWIITGLLFRKLSKSYFGKIAAAALVIILFISNAANSAIRFERLASASQIDKGDYPQDQLLFQDESYPVVLKQQKGIAEWIRQNSPGDAEYVFLWAPSYYYRPILYFLSETELKDKARYMSNYPVWSKGSYFAITRTTKPEKFFRGEKEKLFQVANYQVFGTLTVYKLELTEKGQVEAQKREQKFLRGLTITSPEKTEKHCLKKPKPTCRFNWHDIFNL